MLKTFLVKIDEFEGNEFLENLSKNKNQDFYGSRQKYTEIETLGKVKKKAISTRWQQFSRSVSFQRL